MVERLETGKMFLVDMNEGRIINDEEIKNKIVSERPYKEWLDKHIRRLTPIEKLDASLIGKRVFDDDAMAVYHKLHAYSYEEIQQVVKVLAKDVQ